VFRAAVLSEGKLKCTKHLLQDSFPFATCLQQISLTCSADFNPPKYLPRLLEAQIATGGIIDMQSPVRISVQVAQKRGLLDERIAERLSRRETASYYDPMTGENLNYSELMAR